MGLTAAARWRVVAAWQAIRPVTTRLPFKYGAAVLTKVPVLHLGLRLEGPRGQQATGYSADCLPPGWFDKRPGRTLRDDVASLLFTVDQAVATALAAEPRTAFEHWLAAYHAVRRVGLARGETPLTCGFGPALLERALLCALGRAAGCEFHQTLRTNLAGLDFAALNSLLGSLTPERVLAVDPLETIGVRQTIGLLDPLTPADQPPGSRLGDGLPETLEEYLLVRGLRYLKIKVGGQLDRDLDRLRTIARLIDLHVPARCVVSLDGNEQYQSLGQLAVLLTAIQADPALQRLWAGIEYVEQPLTRDRALAPALLADLPAISALKPVIVDESDDSLETFPRAIELGYRGISVKNCKGVSKALLNTALAAWHNAQRRESRYFLTGEDLMNTAVVPVQQDLCTAMSLGLSHVERNGHHYVRGLDHLSPDETASCLRDHASLYEPLPPHSGQLRICDGLLDVRSLRCIGYGVAGEPDWGWLTPREQWRYEDLGLSD
ncbi:MAG: hypothetical protein IT204_24425 [Fimbriimonadaceae bacterium]|nr:hypothetical protein [Fimbriimonadaceae bacterium]